MKTFLAFILAFILYPSALFGQTVAVQFNEGDFLGNGQAVPINIAAVLKVQTGGNQFIVQQAPITFTPTNVSATNNSFTTNLNVGLYNMWFEGVPVQFALNITNTGSPPLIASHCVVSNITQWNASNLTATIQNLYQLHGYNITGSDGTSISTNGTNLVISSGANTNAALLATGSAQAFSGPVSIINPASAINPVAITFTNGQVFWIDSNTGNDANDGTSPMRAKRTPVGTFTNGPSHNASVMGATYIFAPGGTYDIGGPGAFQMTNNAVIEDGATMTILTNASLLGGQGYFFITFSNFYLQGGTWWFQGSNTVPVEGVAVGPSGGNITLEHVTMHGNLDCILGSLGAGSNYLIGCNFDSHGDVVFVNGVGSNSTKLFIVGGSQRSFFDGPGDSFQGDQDALTLLNLTATVTGCNLEAVNGGFNLAPENIGINAAGSVINIGGTAILSTTTNNPAVTPPFTLQGDPATVWNIQGHPYAESSISGGHVNFIGDTGTNATVPGGLITVDTNGDRSWIGFASMIPNTAAYSSNHTLFADWGQYAYQVPGVTSGRSYYFTATDTNTMTQLVTEPSDSAWSSGSIVAMGGDTSAYVLGPASGSTGTPVNAAMVVNNAITAVFPYLAVFNSLVSYERIETIGGSIIAGPGGTFGGNGVGITNIQAATALSGIMPAANLPPFITESFTSNFVTSVTKVINVAHGMGATPSFVSAWVVCVTADVPTGYAVGDKIEIGGAYDPNGFPMFAITRNATNVVVSEEADVVASPSSFNLIPKGGGALQQPTATANFKLEVDIVK